MSKKYPVIVRCESLLEAFALEVKVCELPSLTYIYTSTNLLTQKTLFALLLSYPRLSTMVDMSSITRMASDFTIDDLAHLKSLLDRKLHNIPEHHLPTLTINDILQQAPQALHIPTIPPDIQLPFLLRNRSIINHDNVCPIKDERKQTLKVTRTIFFYHLNEAQQFQRFHDTSRWNLALFTALLGQSSTSTMSPTSVRPSRRPDTPLLKTEYITPAARRFMTSYLAAVMERHNTPTVFTAREEFIQRWKNGAWELFQQFRASQRKLLKREMYRLSAQWEDELDMAMKEMGRPEYERRIAPFVGSIIPGRKDQGLPPCTHDHLRRFARSASPSPEAREGMNMELQEAREGRNELLDALRVPLEEREYQNHHRDEEVQMPADIRYAIAAMQNVRPADMLQVLMRLFPVVEEERQFGWDHAAWERPGS